jgi:type III secretion protein L
MEDKVIKGKTVGNAAVDPPKLLKHDVYQAGIEARGILETAELRARELLEEAARSREEALEAGRQQGYREGLAQWDEARLGMLRLREAMDARYEGELVRLSVRIAEKIIGEELRTRPETIVSIVRECVRGMRNQQSLTVRVNASEREEVIKHIESLNGLGSGIQVVADSGVPQGGCIVESERGIVDARLQTQLQGLEDILTRIASRP